MSWTAVTLDAFLRADASSVGNNWRDMESAFSIVGHTAQVNASGLDDYLLLRPVSENHTSSRAIGVLTFGGAPAQPSVMIRGQIASGALSGYLLSIFGSFLQIYTISGTAGAGAFTSLIGVGNPSGFLTGHRYAFDFQASGTGPTTLVGSIYDLTVAGIDPTGYTAAQMLTALAGLTPVVTGTITDSTSAQQAAGAPGIGASAYGGSATVPFEQFFSYTQDVLAADFSLAETGGATLVQGASTTGTVTLTPINSFTGTATLSASGLPSGVTASFAPTTVTGGGTVASTLTLTASSGATTGTVTVTVTGTDSADSLTHSTTFSLTVNAASRQAITYNNAALYYSLANWVDTGTFMETPDSGAYLKVNFTGTSLIMAIDLTQYGGASASFYPKVEWKVDGGAWNTLTTTGGLTSITLATALASGTHTVEFWVVALTYQLDRYSATPVSTFRITGLTVDTGATVAAPTLLPGKLIGFDDSNGEGQEVLGPGVSIANQNARLGPIAVMARAMNCEVTIVAKSSQGYTVAGGGGVPSLVTSWSVIYGTHSRLTAGKLPAYDHLVVMEGENDGTYPAATVTSQIAVWRAALTTSAKIFVVSPPSNASLTATTSGVTAAGDANAFFLNIGQQLVYVATGGDENSFYHLNQSGAAFYGGRAAVLATAAISGGGGATNVLVASSSVLAGVPCGVTGAGTVGNVYLPVTSNVLATITYGASHSLTGTATTGGGGGGGFTSDDAALFASTLLSTMDAIEPGENFAQTLRLLRAEALGKLDITSVPGTGIFYRADGTTEAFRGVYSTVTGRLTATLGSGL